MHCLDRCIYELSAGTQGGRTESACIYICLTNTPVSSSDDATAAGRTGRSLVRFSERHAAYLRHQVASGRQMHQIANVNYKHADTVHYSCRCQCQYAFCYHSGPSFTVYDSNACPIMARTKKVARKTATANQPAKKTPTERKADQKSSALNRSRNVMCESRANLWRNSHLVTNISVCRQSCCLERACQETTRSAGQETPIQAWNGSAQVRHAPRSVVHPPCQCSHASQCEVCVKRTLLLSGAHTDIDRCHVQGNPQTSERHRSAHQPRPVPAPGARNTPEGVCKVTGRAQLPHETRRSAGSSGSCRGLSYPALRRHQPGRNSCQARDNHAERHAARA